MEKDIFGFADAINIDHLNLEQLKELEKILDKIKQQKMGRRGRACRYHNVMKLSACRVDFQRFFWQSYLVKLNKNKNACDIYHIQNVLYVRFSICICQSDSVGLDI